MPDITSTKIARWEVSDADLIAQAEEYIASLPAGARGCQSNIHRTDPAHYCRTARAIDAAFERSFRR